MSNSIELPKLGESADAGTVVSILVSTGDPVEEGQGLIEVETDKATTEVPSTAAGTVSSVHVSEGDEVRAGDALVTLDGNESGEDGEADDGGAQGEQDSDSAGARDDDEAEADDDDPDVDDDTGSGDSGDAATDEAPDDPERGAEAEAQDDDPRAADSDDDGKDKPGDDPTADDDTKDEDTEDEDSEDDDTEDDDTKDEDSEDEDTEDEDTEEVESGAGSSAGADHGRPRDEGSGGDADDDHERGERDAGIEHDPSGNVATPSVRRFARDLGLDVRDIARSAGDRVTEDDVKAHARRLLGEGEAEGGSRRREPDLPDFSRWGDVEHEPMGPIRRRTAEVMQRSWRLIPHVTHTDRADVTEVEAFRRRVRGDEDAEADDRLTLTVVLVKLLAEAAGRFPRVNSSVVPERAELVLKRYVHVGVAVATPSGLLLPVVRDADQKSLRTLAVELDDLAGRARSGKLEPDEVQGASVSITNVGGIGGRDFTPIVPWPQVAVLGVGEAYPELRLRGGAPEERTMLPLMLSYDHRAVDGADAARFLRWMREALAEPMRLKLDAG